MTNVATHSTNNHDEQRILNKASVMIPINPFSASETICFPFTHITLHGSKALLRSAQSPYGRSQNPIGNFPTRDTSEKDAYTFGYLVNDWFFCLVSPRIFAGDDSNAFCDSKPRSRASYDDYPDPHAGHPSRLTKLVYAPPSRFHHHPNPTLPRR